MTQHYVPSQPLPPAPQGPAPQEPAPHGQAPRGPQPPPAGPARMRNALGVWSLVLGILGLVFSWVPFAGMGTYATGVTGLVLGLVGAGRVAKHVADNKGVAVSGVILNAIALVSVILATVAYSAFLYAAGTSGQGADRLPSTAITGRADPGTGDAGAGAGAGAANEPRAKGIGDRVRDGDLRFKVTSVRRGVSHLGGEFGKDAQGQYVVFNVNVKNVGDESVTFDDSDQYLFGTGGKRFSTDTEAGIWVNSNSFLEDVNPGNTVHGKLVFDVPKSFQADHLELHGSMFSEGATVRVAR